VYDELDYGDIRVCGVQNGGLKLVTIKDIAKQAGVNFGTVSRALNNEPGVSEKTRAEIRAIAERMNYVPNMAARRMVDRSSSGIGVIWPKLEGLFFYHLGQRIQREAAARKQRVMLSFAEPEEALRSFQEHFIDKVIHWAHTEHTASYLAAKQTFPGTVLEIGDWADGQSFCLDIDRKGAIYKAVRHLFELGHRRIAFCGANTKKFAGYEQGLIDFRLDFSSASVVNTKPSDPEIKQKISKSLEIIRSEHTTAVIVDSQGTLFEFIKMVQSANIRIPDQLSLVCYDDVPELHHLLPVPITTVGPDVGELAKKMLDSLLEPVDRQISERSVHIVESVLTVRDSTQAPPLPGL
jgi:LacI family transcriptional regulator